MWHERLSSPSSPSPSRSTTNSPLPRRPTNSGPVPVAIRSSHSTINPRSSSLSLLSTPASSATNLAAGLKAAHTSSLKHELRTDAPPPPNLDPLKALEDILPPNLDRASLRPRISDDITLPDGLDEPIDFQGHSLDEYAAQATPEHAISSVVSTSIGSEKYEKDQTRFEDLHKSIVNCDQVLESVETYLTGFKSDLGAVSAEIETLQKRSDAMNARLQNRRVVEKLLGPAVEELSISPEVIKRIIEGPIDELWIKALGELDRKAKIVQSKASESKRTRALDDLLPILQSLVNKAIERIRDYIVSRIKAIRSPNINAQIIQSQGLRPYRDLYTFLDTHHHQLATEICQAYINTMRWYYLNQFSRYEIALKSIKLYDIGKSDLIGVLEDSSSRRSARPAGPSHDAFSLGRRIDLVRTSSTQALTSYAAEEDKSSHYLETVFRSFSLALVDNAAYEFTFLSSFFSPALSYHNISRTFEAIFAPTFKLGQELTKSLVESSTDALGILICVRLNQHFAFEFQRRKVPPGEGYTNGTSMLLWPRFQKVMDLHCESLRKLSLNAPSTAPHPITQRFASFLEGILILSSESSDDEPVSRSLDRLKKDYEGLITKLSKTIGDTRKRERFLYNNYSLVGTILEEATGKLAEQHREHFRELKDTYGAEPR